MKLKVKFFSKLRKFSIFNDHISGQQINLSSTNTLVVKFLAKLAVSWPFFFFKKKTCIIGKENALKYVR